MKKTILILALAFPIVGTVFTVPAQPNYVLRIDGEYVPADSVWIVGKTTFFTGVGEGIYYGVKSKRIGSRY